MKNIFLDTTKKLLQRKLVFFSCFVLAANQNIRAQFVNNALIKITEGAIVSFYTDYENKNEGEFINDGNVYVYNNWLNDGITSFNKSKKGITVFEGREGQIIEGDKTSNFNNVVFDNSSSVTPFHLASVFEIDGNVNFTKGVIDAHSYGGKVVIGDNASVSEPSNSSHVYGWVEKRNVNDFDFPVGAFGYLRPAHISKGNVERCEYFYDKSGALLEGFADKEESIQFVDNIEYWDIQNNGEEKRFVLGLTINPNTTPSEFFLKEEGSSIVLVRWDSNSKKWINEGGEVEDAVLADGESKLIMGEVRNHGIFTVGKVKNKKPVHSDDLEINNAISANNDGINDTFKIKGIAKYPNNTVEIFNRWGVQVFKAKSYNESDIVFSGYSNGRTTISKDSKLPSGTYFYTLKYVKNDETIRKQGYLYLSH